MLKSGSFQAILNPFIRSDIIKCKLIHFGLVGALHFAKLNSSILNFICVCVCVHHYYQIITRTTPNVAANSSTTIKKENQIEQLFVLVSFV